MMMILFLLMVIFISSVQPMMMVSSLIFITLVYSYMVNSIMSSYWFSYALIMVMLSGVLVLFTYMVSLIPNESFESYNFIMIFIVMIMVMFGYMYMYKNDLSYLCMELWSSYVGLINIFMVAFLFGIMLVVVWLSCMNEGAVRIS